MRGLRRTIRDLGINRVVSQLVHESISWRPLAIDMAWYSIVRWKQSCSVDRCGPMLFLGICWSSETRQVCEPQSIVFNLPSTRFELSSVSNKAKRQEIVTKLKQGKGQRKLQTRLAIAIAILADPAAGKVRLPSSRHRGNWLDNVCFYSRRGWPRTSPRPLIAKGSLTPPY